MIFFFFFLKFKQNLAARDALDSEDVHRKRPGAKRAKNGRPPGSIQVMAEIL